MSPSTRDEAKFVPRAGNDPNRGFTWVEILLAFVLIGVILAFAIPNLMESREAAKIAQAVGDLRSIEAEIDLFEAASERLPVSLAEINRDGLLDPWDNPYQYLNFRVEGDGRMRRDRNLKPINSTYDLYSMGKDGDSATPLTARPSWDDIVRADDGGYLGLASEY